MTAKTIRGDPLSVQVRRLGRYRLEGVLGYGGMAVVYLGYDAELDRQVAIKLLADNLASDAGLRQRFLREAKLAGRLTHPNIVHVYDAGEQDGRPYIVMEYVAGETLAEVLARERRLAPAAAVRLAMQACAGLEHAHAAGLVHRDIKPQNLLLREDGTLKVADFGIARSAHGTRLTEIGSILGTAAYLAPEQAAGEEVSAATDVYALGVVLFQLLTGVTPYSYETLTQLLVGQQTQPVPAVSDYAPAVPAALEQLVMRCLARLSEYRPRSAAALAQELQATMPDLPACPLRGTHASEAPTALGRGATAPYANVPRADRRLSRFAQLGLKQLLVAAAVAVAMILLVVALASGGGSDDGPGPTPAPAEKPALEQARELSSWLRSHTR